MTNYEKMIKDMSIDRFVTMLINDGNCPFAHSCNDCDFDKPLLTCGFSEMTDEEMIEWLESEVE